MNEQNPILGTSKETTFNVEDIKNAECSFVKEGDVIKKALLTINGTVVQACGSPKYRLDTISTIYNKLINEKNLKIVECGVGTGLILEEFKKLNFEEYTVVEINKQLSEYFQDDKVINDEFYNFVKNNDFQDTAFIIRIPIPEKANVVSFLKYLSSNFGHLFNKNNYIVIDTFDLNFTLNNIEQKIELGIDNVSNNMVYSYFIKL